MPATKYASLWLTVYLGCAGGTGYSQNYRKRCELCFHKNMVIQGIERNGKGEGIPSGEKTPSPCGYSPFQVGESIRKVSSPLGGDKRGVSL